MVEPQPSKLAMPVRSRSPALPTDRLITPVCPAHYGIGAASAPLSRIPCRHGGGSLGPKEATASSVTDNQDRLPRALPPGGTALVGGSALGERECGRDRDLQFAGVDHLRQPLEALPLRRHDEELGRDAVLVGQLLRWRNLENQQVPAASERGEQRLRGEGADGIDRDVEDARLCVDGLVVDVDYPLRPEGA